jgi:hypothetical protein
MANLKRVKFLDPEFDAPTRPDHGSMGAEYMKKKSDLDSSLQRVIDKSRVAHMLVLKKSKTQIEKERKEYEDEMKRNPLAKLMAVDKPRDENGVPIVVEADKFADGFVRSKRNT